MSKSAMTASEVEEFDRAWRVRVALMLRDPDTARQALPSIRRLCRAVTEKQT